MIKGKAINMSILTTREWATLVWGSFLLIFVICHREARKALGKVIVIFFSTKLRILWEVILLYVLTITMIFSRLSIWDNTYIKDISVWFMFSGLIYCMNAVSSEADEKYTLRVLKDNLKATLFLEFFMSTFTFNIWVELAIIPIITIITLMNIIAERKEEYKNVHKFLDRILAIAGLCVLYETVKIGIVEYKKLNVVNTLVSFMIPIVYLILITPLEYALELYAKYELLFTRMSYWEEEGKSIRRMHRAGIIISCGISVRRVLLFQKKFMARMYVGMSDGDFKKLLQEFRMVCKKRGLIL